MIVDLLCVAVMSSAITVSVLSVWILFIAISVAAAIFTFRNFSTAFPLVSIDLRMDREAALRTGRALAQDNSWHCRPRGTSPKHRREPTAGQSSWARPLSAASIRERGALLLPFGSRRTSPIAAADVARVVATVLGEPAGRTGKVYELTGPEVLDIDGIAEQYSRALGRPVIAQEFRLADAGRAHEAVMQDGKLGKIILVP